MTHSFAGLDQALSLASHGRYEEALRICDTFILNWPHAYAGYYRRSNVLSMMGRHHDAVEALNKVAELMPDHAFPYFMRAEAYSKLGDFRRAIADLDAAERRDDGFFGHEIPLQRADCHLKSGNIEKAIGECETIPDDYRSPGFRGSPHGSKHLIMDEIARARRRG